jgi:hypothetical protein
MKIIRAPTGRDVSTAYHAPRRAARARREIIRLQLQLQEILEPRSRQNEEFFFSEKEFIEKRITELRTVIDEENEEAPNVE